MDGLRIVTVDDASNLVLEMLTQRSEGTLDARLVEYSHKRTEADEDPDCYSLDTTIEELVQLHDTKGEMTQLGIDGELVAHLLLPQGHEKLLSAAIFLNKKERAITFHDDHDGSLWCWVRGQIRAHA